MMNKNAVIVTTVGLVIGVAEALLYYNLGQSQGGQFAYKIPPKRELLKTIGVVLVTSILTAGISGFIESQFQEDKKVPA
jgi:hypothetical protein